MNNRVLIILATIVLLASVDSKAFVGEKINYGDTVYNILRKNRFSMQQVNQALSGKILPKSFALVPGEHYYKHRDESGLELRFFDPIHDVAYVFFYKKGAEGGSRIENIKFNTKVRTVSGKIHGSIIASMRKKIKDKRVAYRFLDAFLYDYKPRKQLQRGAHYKVSYEEKYYNNRLIKTGEVLSAELEIGGGVKKRWFVHGDEGGAFVHTDWNQNKRPLYSPADYSRFSSLFSYRRRHPIKGYVKPHLGLDFELPTGTPLFTTASGTVLRVGKNRAAGRYVVIKHRNGMETYYNHLSKINSKMKKGAYVKVGQVVGLNGCSGYCTKPHLHFALKKNGRWLDPIKYIKSYSYNQRSRVKRKLAQN